MFTVFFRNQGRWCSTTDYDTAEQAYQAQEDFRKLKIEAYAVNLRTVVEEVPDHVLSDVERSLQH